MNDRLVISLLIGITLFLSIILILLKRRKLNIKYSLVWLTTVLCMIFATLFPGIIAKIATFIGIVTPINFVFIIEGVFVLIIILSLTVIVSRQNEKIYRLVQTQAILEKKIRDIEDKVENK